MTKTITISDETYKKLKDQLKEEKLKEKKTMVYTKEDLIELLKTNIEEFNKVVGLKEDGGHWEDLPKISDKLDLRKVNLWEADLRKVNLREANLSRADLWKANLWGADLREANLGEAKFYGKGGKTKIKESQLDDFLKALGVVVEK